MVLLKLAYIIWCVAYWMQFWKLFGKIFKCDMLANFVHKIEQRQTPTLLCIFVQQNSKYAHINILYSSLYSNARQFHIFANHKLNFGFFAMLSNKYLRAIAVLCIIKLLLLQIAKIANIRIANAAFHIDKPQSVQRISNNWIFFVLYMNFDF